MARRTKSFNDIFGQSDRLKTELKRQIKEAANSGDRQRVRQLRDRYINVMNTADRYTDNIARQKADQNAVRKADEMQRQGRNKESAKIAKKADSRQWSQSTYMGVNAG